MRLGRITTIMRFPTLINQTSSFYIWKNAILLQIFHLFVCLSASRVTKRMDRFDSSIMCNSTMVNPYNYVVSLSAYSGNNNDNAEECSGTLISERHILTSASCVQNRDGESYDKVNVILRPCSSIIINRTVLRNGIVSHKDYNYTHTAQGDNDIAILRMSERIDLKTNLLPSLVSLPEKCNSCIVDYDGEPAVAVGWNETSIAGEEIGQVMHVEVAVQSNQWCKKEAGNFYLFNDDYQLCTAPIGLVPSDTEESCQRHSGGPVLVNGTQIGIKSYGSGKCAEAAIYTRVSAYVNSGWIAEKMAL